MGRSWSVFIRQDLPISYPVKLPTACLSVCLSVSLSLCLSLSLPLSLCLLRQWRSERVWRSTPACATPFLHSLGKFARRIPFSQNTAGLWIPPCILREHRSRTNRQTQTQTLTLTRTRTHTHTQTHTYTHRHTHRHTTTKNTHTNFLGFLQEDLDQNVPERKL